MNLQAARCELRNPPGIGWWLLLGEAAIVIAIALGVALAVSA